MSSRPLKAVDLFGLFAGGIGLIADFIGLSSLLALSTNSEGSTSEIAGDKPIILLVAGVLIVYSIALVSFTTRKFFFSRYVIALKASPEEIIATRSERRNTYAGWVMRRVDRGTLSITMLAGIPLTIGFALAIFSADAANGFSSRSLDFLPGLRDYPSDKSYTLTGGIVYGGFAGYTISLAISDLMRLVYAALDLDYPG